MTTHMRIRIGAAIAACALLPALAGCSHASKMTCAEYEELGEADQMSTLIKVLQEHDLRGLDSGNILGISNAVSNYCVMQDHPDSPLEDAVDWSASHW